MGDSLNNKTRHFTRVLVRYSADVIGNEQDIERLSPAQHLPAGYSSSSAGSGYGSLRREEMEAIAALFTCTEDDSAYNCADLAAGGRDHYLPAASRPAHYEGTGYRGQHRTWVAELTRAQWLLFAKGYLIELDDRGYPVRYEEEEATGSLTGKTLIGTACVDNSEGWETAYGGTVISSRFHLSFGCSVSGPSCEKCGHLFGPHQVIALTGNPLEGGIILCPDCGCLGTWAVGDNQPPELPAPEIIEQIRQQIRGDQP
jgi:hypothetical protein